MKQDPVCNMNTLRQRPQGVKLIKKDDPYCCEKCYFRDKFSGDVTEKMEGAFLSIIEAFVDAIDAREHPISPHNKLLLTALI